MNMTDKITLTFTREQWLTIIDALFLDADNRRSEAKSSAWLADLDGSDTEENLHWAHLSETLAHEISANIHENYQPEARD
jgi:hypothetical protein